MPNFGALSVMSQTVLGFSSMKSRVLAMVFGSIKEPSSSPGANLSSLKKGVLVISGFMQLTATPLPLNSSNKESEKSLSPDFVAVYMELNLACLVASMEAILTM